MKSLALVAGLALMSSACAFHGGPASEAKRLLDPGSAVRLHVTNRSGAPMDVYAVGSGTWYRVGTVHPGMDGRFQVRPGMVANGAVELVARSTSGLVINSGPVLLGPGTEVEFQLTPQAATSAATVLPGTGW